MSPATRPAARPPNPALLPPDTSIGYLLGLALVGAGFTMRTARTWYRQNPEGNLTEVWVHRPTERITIYDRPGGKAEVSFRDAIGMAERGEL